MSSKRRSRRVLTLQGQVLGSFFTVVIVMAAIIGTATLLLLSRFLTEQLDTQVRNTTVRLGGPPAHHEVTPPVPDDERAPTPMQQLCSPTNDADPGGRQPDNSVFAVVHGNSTQAEVIAAVRGEFPTCTTVSAGAARTLAGVAADGHIVTVTLGAFGDYRVIAQRAGGDTIVSGLSTAAVQATEHRVALIFISVTGMVLVAGGAGMWWSVRRRLRPLRQVADTARSATALRLDQGEVDLRVRVPAEVTDPRTEVGQVGASLDRLLQHVGDALDSRQKAEMRIRRFVADASHELRTPLTAIRGYAELAGRHPDDSSTVHHALRRVRSESERMSSLVDDMLLLARLDAGRPLDRSPVDLSRLVFDAIADAQVAAPSHQWRTEVPAEPVVTLGDESRLRQVVANLLSNAGKHTPDSTIITVRLYSDGADAAVTVSDNGTGIGPDLQPHIFDRFVRGDPSRSTVHPPSASTGLGLAIVAAVVKAHHGSVAVDSDPDGATFTVRLPLATPDDGIPTSTCPQQD